MDAHLQNDETLQNVYGFFEDIYNRTKRKITVGRDLKWFAVPSKF